MELMVTLEHRFDQTPDGAVWTQTMFPLPFWQTYLETFDRVRIVARTRQVAAVSDDFLRVDGEGVELFPIPYYVGPAQYLRRIVQVRRAARMAIGPRHAVILRVSSQIANCLDSYLIREGRPYGVVVVTDPWEVFAPGVVRHPLRPFFRRYFAACLRRQCRRASAAAYVTESTLQRRYPPAASAFATHCSDVELPASAVLLSPRREFCADGLPRLITVASLSQMYKGIDVLIDAVARCVRDGFRLHLTIVGDGAFRSALETRARRAGCPDCIAFLGSLPAGEAVRRQLDKADLFVLPSRVEGLPRAMIEAMARGLPCIGTHAGGIPELIPADARVPVGNAEALASKIREMLASPARMRGASRRNLDAAGQYRDDILRERRILFCEAVRDATRAWLAAAGTRPTRVRRSWVASRLAEDGLSRSSALRSNRQVVGQASGNTEAS